MTNRRTPEAREQDAGRARADEQERRLAVLEERVRRLEAGRVAVVPDGGGGLTLLAGKWLGEDVL